MGWGGGCPCHDVASQCWRKGRRLPEAYEFASQALKEGLHEANEWCASSFLALDVSELQGVVRSTYLMGLRKIGYLNKIPHLFARLDQPGVKALCQAQFDSAPLHSHCPVSKDFFGPGGPFAADVALIQPDGTGITETLALEIQSIKDIPMDDSVGEGPHARRARIQRAASSVKWPYVASTMRAAQNLNDVDTLVGELGVDLDTEWRRHSSVLQIGDPRQRGRPKRIGRGELERRLYTMCEFIGEDCDVRDDGEADGDEGGGGGGGGGVAGVAGADPGVDSGVMLEIPAHGEVAEVPGPDPHSLHREKLDVKLLRQFLQASIEPLTYVSFPTPSWSGASSSFFQILSIDRNLKFAQTFEDRMGTAPGMFDVSVQHLELSGVTSPEELIVAGTADENFDTFVIDQPFVVDVIELIGSDQLSRWSIFKWQYKQSDTDGSITLSSPSLVRPPYNLADQRIPALCLLDRS